MDVLLPLLVGLTLTTVLGVIGYFLYVAFKPSDGDLDYSEQMSVLLGEEVKKEESDNIIKKWNRYWGRLLGESNIDRYELDDEVTAGREVLMLFLGVFFVMLFLTKNPAFGALLVGVVWYLITFYVNTASYKKIRAIDDQLSGLLFSIKSNLQSGQTNERALMGVVDSMPEPLRQEVSVGKSVLAANGRFSEALEAIAAGTASRDLKFLCACMIQASDSGSSMTAQLDNIQKVLESRREVANAIDTAIKAVSPALWLAGAVIPVMFLVSYFMDTAAKDFWFKTPLSWVGFFAVVVLYLAGLMLTKRQVDKVRNI